MWKIIQACSLALFIPPLTGTHKDIPDSCRHVVHFHLPTAETYFSLVSSIVKFHTVPTIVFIHTIPNPAAIVGYWDPRAHCVVHLIISEYKDVVRRVFSVLANIYRPDLSEYEHFYAFRKLEKNDMTILGTSSAVRFSSTWKDLDSPPSTFRTWLLHPFMLTWSVDLCSM